jgi:hypothetical protein
MEASPKETAIQKENATPGEKKKKQSWGSMFINFLMMGGFLVVLVLIAAIMILVSYLAK